MSGLCIVDNSGRVGADAEVRHTPSGKTVTIFRVAVRTRIIGGDEITTWWRCSGWGEHYEKLAQYIRKGDQVRVVGEGYVREYESAGAKKWIAECRLSHVDLLTPKPKAAQPAASAVPVPEWTEDQIPF